VASRTRRLAHFASFASAATALAILSIAPPTRAQIAAGAPLDAPAWGEIPKRDVLRLGLTDAAEISSGGSPRRAFTRLDATLGLPLGVGLRASLPFADDGASLRAGSALAAMSLGRSFRIGPFAFVGLMELGLLTPSLRATPWDAFDQRIAVDTTSFRPGFFFGLLHGPTGLSLAAVGHSNDWAYRAGWQDRAARFTTSLGIRPSTSSGPSQLRWDVSFGLSDDVRVGLFGALHAAEPRDSLWGLSLRWDLPLAAAARTRPTRGEPDMYEVHAAGLTDVGVLAVPGKVTIVELGAKWCTGCFLARSDLRRRVTEDPDLAVRTVDVDEATELHLSAVPTFVVFDRACTLVGEVYGFQAPQLDRMIEVARARH
jgi:hypothetical protein